MVAVARSRAIRSGPAFFDKPTNNDMTGILPFNPSTTRLDNGLTVIALPVPSPGLASVWTIVRTGSRDEYEPGRTGFAHFFEHMMFRGTEKYPAERYQQILTGLGSDANAYTTDDLTAYHIAGAPADIGTVFEIESDRFMRLDYPEGDFRTEAGAVYGEYRKDKTEPLFVLYEAMRQKTFARHTYGHTTLGYEADIAAMPGMYDYSREFFGRYYRPENAVLLVTGDIEPAAIHDLAATHFGDWAPGYVEPDVPAEPEQAAQLRTRAQYDGKTLPLLWHAYRIGRFDPDNRIRVAADLLVQLAYGETSDVYRQLVLHDQSVEFLAAYTNMNRDPSVLDVYCRIKDPDRISEIEDRIEQTNAVFREKTVGRNALAALKSRLRYGFLMGLETPDDVAGALARPLAISGNLEQLDALYAAYERVTPDDIQAAANTVLVEQQRTVGILRGRDD